MPHADTKHFRHEALFYDGSESFVDRVGPFLEAGLVAGEPVMVMARPVRLRQIRGRFARDASRIRLVDMASAGRNPARIIPIWQSFVDAADGKPARGVGEPIWPERSPDEVAECHLHEKLINLAFATAGSFRLTCPYDSSALSPALLAEARTTHPFGDGNEIGDYRGPPTARALFSDPLPPAPAGAGSLAFSETNVRSVRELAEAVATSAGLDEVAAGDVALVAHELAINSLIHGGGGGTLRMWTNAGALTGEITDRGNIRTPMVGRIRPGIEHENGRGVWLANQLCDLVQIRSGARGTVVRFSVAHA